MATAKTKSEVGIIGQMYEDRKSKKIGVLESREEKFKTLMMRDKEGKSFNITYSTFKSNWRKYNGEESIQTSTQVSEEKAETEKRKADNKKIVESKQEVVKISTEEKVKKLKALESIIADKIKSKNVDLKTNRTSKGGIIVRNKKYKLFEIWIKFNKDRYEFVSRDELIAVDKKKYDDIAKSTGSKLVIHENWVLKSQYLVPNDKYEEVLDTLLDMSAKFIESREEK